jgi:hypothetical protein
MIDEVDQFVLESVLKTVWNMRDGYPLPPSKQSRAEARNRAGPVLRYFGTGFGVRSGSAKRKLLAAPSEFFNLLRLYHIKTNPLFL